MTGLLQRGTSAGAAALSSSSSSRQRQQQWHQSRAATFRSPPDARPMSVARPSWHQGSCGRRAGREACVVHAVSLDRNQLSAGLKRATEQLKAAVLKADPWAHARQHVAREAAREFFTDLRRETAEARLAQDFVMYEAGHARKFTRDEYLHLVYNITLPAVPDFSWNAVSTYEADADGYMLVTVQATGHHTGAPLAMPGMPTLPPSGRHFCLEEEAQMVRVQDGKIKEIKVFPVRGAGPRAMYAALGGQVPQLVSAGGQEQPPLP